MKKAVFFVVIGFLAAVVFLAIMSLCLAMPDILAWIAGYIGTTMTWVIFLTAVGGIIVWCLPE